MIVAAAPRGVPYQPARGVPSALWNRTGRSRGSGIAWRRRNRPPRHARSKDVIMSRISTLRHEADACAHVRALLGPWAGVLVTRGHFPGRYLAADTGLHYIPAAVVGALVPSLAGRVRQ